MFCILVVTIVFAFVWILFLISFVVYVILICLTSQAQTTKFNINSNYPYCSKNTRENNLAKVNEAFIDSFILIRQQQNLFWMDQITYPQSLKRMIMSSEFTSSEVECGWQNSSFGKKEVHTV